VLFFTDCGGDDFFAACIILVGCLEMCLRLLSRWHQINVGIIYCAPLSLSPSLFSSVNTPHQSSPDAERALQFKSHFHSLTLTAQKMPPRAAAAAAAQS